VGATAEDNVVVQVWGQAPRLPFTPRQHFEIGEALGMLDFERAAKVSGSRFVFYRGALARLERALAAFMIDVHTSRGYTELLPPYLVSRATLTTTGQLPKFEEDVFRTAGDNELFLIPTAEVPVTGHHARRSSTASPRCRAPLQPPLPRRGRGGGKDTRGSSRQHQFHKVELVNFSRPEQSMEALERRVDDATEVLRRLGLHPAVLLCTGDPGLRLGQTYDLEVWLPGRARSGRSAAAATASTSGPRGRSASGRGGRQASLPHPQRVGTGGGPHGGGAAGEHQWEDGTVRPPVLAPYLGGQTELAPAPDRCNTGRNG
jgi:seryl-tRNA synthetase